MSLEICFFQNIGPIFHVNILKYTHGGQTKSRFCFINILCMNLKINPKKELQKNQG